MSNDHPPYGPQGPGQQGPGQQGGQPGGQPGWGQGQQGWGQQGQQGWNQQGQQSWGQQGQQGWGQPDQGGQNWQQAGPGGGWNGPQGPQGPGGWGEPPRKRRKGLWIGGAAAATALVLVGGGVFAFNQVLGGGGAQPAEVIPDSAFAYARIDLDPSAGQKINILRLLNKVPEFQEETGIDDEDADLRKVLFEQTIGKDDSCDVDYAKDVEPWIGDRAAVAALPGTDDEPAPLIALQVSDREAADAGIKKLESCEEDSDEGGYAFTTDGDYVLYAESKKQAEDAVADAEKAPLSEAERFSADMGELGEQGVLSFWADIEQAGKASGADEDDLKAVTGLGYKSVAAAVRAGSDYIELATAANWPDAPGSDKRTQLGQLPDDTVLGVGVSGGNEAVAKGWDTLEGSLGDETVDSTLRELESSTGISLPDDLETLLGDNFTMAVGERGLAEASDLQSPADLKSVDVGFRSQTDAGELKGIVDSVNKLVTQVGASPLVTKDADGGLVVATNDEWAGKLADGGTLGDSGRFKTVVPDADEATSAMFVDVDKAAGIAQQIAEASGDDTDFVKYLEPIEAIGASSQAPDGDYVTGSLRVSFD